ncbi:MAG TPA: M48 family metalloprotease [Terriglobales bacterium]|nr:M48 family metalloprotease [Terriglobales bacterium]
MKRWIILAAIVALGLGAIFVSERRKVDVPPGPAAMLYLVADTEQELTRMPVRFTRMTDQGEVAIGNEMAKGYNWTDGRERTPEDAEVERYLNQVGARLAPQAHRKLPYKFHYIHDLGFINAFALPGGHVYVGAGLLSLMDSEDELASVIGHEIEHIDHYHCAERVQQEQALRKLPLGGLVAIPVQVFEAGYSKDQELEADREGTRLAVGAGYSANGAIRMFETFQRLYQQVQNRSRTPEEELSQVAWETLQGYFRSHPLPSERIEQINRMIASEHWPVKPERDLTVAYVFWTEKAQAALQAHRYKDAEQLAQRSLNTRPDQVAAIVTLARAQFAQAKFGPSAASFRKAADANFQYAEDYAQALAAANPRQAASEFHSWSESKGNPPIDLVVTNAGLQLLAGNPEPARLVQSQITDPELRARLGWWYYRAGDFSTAENLLQSALQERPGNAAIRIRLTWTQIDLMRLSDALDTVNTVYEEGTTTPERGMAKAVAEWLAQQPDQALTDYETALNAEPEWGDPQWVRALYSEKSASAVQNMHDEQEKRRRAHSSLPR